MAYNFWLLNYMIANELSYQKRMSRGSDDDLMDRYNSDTSSTGWVHVRGIFLTALHREFKRRWIDISEITKEDGGLTLGAGNHGIVVGRKVINVGLRNKWKDYRLDHDKTIAAFPVKPESCQSATEWINRCQAAKIKLPPELSQIFTEIENGLKLEWPAFFYLLYSQHMIEIVLPDLVYVRQTWNRLLEKENGSDLKKKPLSRQELKASFARLVRGIESIYKLLPDPEYVFVLADQTLIIRTESLERAYLKEPDLTTKFLEENDFYRCTGGLIFCFRYLPDLKFGSEVAKTANLQKNRDYFEIERPLGGYFFDSHQREGFVRWPGQLALLLFFDIVGLIYGCELVWLKPGMREILDDDRQYMNYINHAATPIAQIMKT